MYRPPASEIYQMPGKVVHLDCNFMDELKEHLFRNHGFRLQCSGDMLHGICKDCENKSDQL